MLPSDREEKQILPLIREDEEEFFDVGEIKPSEAEEDPVFYDVEELHKPCITPMTGYAFATAIIPAFYALIGPSGWTPEEFGTNPKGWLTSMSPFKAIYSFVGAVTSLHINTKFTEFFVPTAFSKLYQDFSHFSENNPVKKVISTACGFFASVPIAMIAYESFGWLSTFANRTCATVAGSVMGACALVNTTASRKAGVDSFFDAATHLFSRTHQSKQKFIAHLNHLDKDQRAIFEEELKEEGATHFPMNQDESEILIEKLHQILQRHPDWQRSDNWLEISGYIFDFALAALMLTSSAPIFFEKALKGFGLLFDIENSSLFTKWLLGALGSISSCLYSISALSARENVTAAFKIDPIFTVLTILENIPACMGMYSVAESVLAHDNFFHLSEDSGFGSALPILVMISAGLVNLYSCMNYWEKTREKPSLAEQPLEVDNVVAWLKNKQNFSEEEKASMRRVFSVFKQLDKKAEVDVEAQPEAAPLLSV